jgi:hypothetical protein
MKQTVWSFALVATALASATVRAQGIPQDGIYAPPQASIDASGFDPYSDPFSPQDPSLLPQTDPFAYPQPGDVVVDPTWQNGPMYERFHLIQRVKFEYTMLAADIGDEPRKLGLDEAEISTTFAIPTMPGGAPVLITPGFAVQWWDGPQDPPGLPVVDFPPQTYSAWLDVAWNPQITPAFGASLAIRPGVYSDFEDVNTDSIRIKGSGLGVFTLSPRWQIAAGAVYLDRSKVKFLPAGGAVWTPNDDVRWELIFPQPKLAQRLTTYGNTSLWWYVGGEYGGDTWSIQRVDGRRDYVDYNDIRVYLGLEFKPVDCMRGISGHVEVGWVFDRELRYLDTTEFQPDDTLMLRAGLAY